ncbi:MAG: hypothetical protein JSS63_05535 [Bacteroidetes bacterium]|nr:hypothetical protein [Bacteroidota bacterium]MBX7045230.1 hypothetical protein [Ignavibacteria bacterium]
MKKIIALCALFCIGIIGCNQSTTVYPPLTLVPVEMGSVALDSVYTSAPGSIIKSGSLGSGPLNFTDRDSTIISFYYHGSAGNTADYQLWIYDSTGSGISTIYLFRDLSVSPAEKFVEAKMPSHQIQAYYRYALKCDGATPQSFAVRNLQLFKK